MITIPKFRTASKQNIRTFALPSENQTYTFKMQYAYDSYNRIQNMTYPDGEVVSYAYNKGGMLKSMTGEKNGVPYWYIYNIHYNEFELKEAVEYGNGTRAFYEYDTLQRLHHLRSESADGTMQDIFYTYNSVSNIIGITNGAGMLPNGLGGAYNNTYTYDGLYRLKISTGTWAGSSTLNYQATTKYRSNGRISEKNLAARQLLNANSDTVNYTHRYYYENTSQPNTLTRYSSSVWNPGSWLSLSNEDDSHFSWDATGNMVSQDPAGDADRRFLCWDEQNRLQGVKDKRWLSYYQYDATGDRTYKLTGKGRLQNISGEWRFFYNLENATLYASPYLVATDKGYTKHYYAETERICSKIGGGMLSNLDRPIVGLEKFQEKKESTIEHFVRVIKDCSHTEYFDAQKPLYNLLNWCDSLQPETNCYWYHPDHLGSSSWITYTDGRAIQHLHYLPWGENFVDQRLHGFNGARYTFSTKERDSETGLSYFGSRYYSSDLSVWLSVDPMSGKYPSLSPYVYCANNPVKLVDPNGEDWFENELTGDVYYSRYLSKDDVSRIEGEGWKWMGKDDMFGSSPTQLALVDHFNKATFVNSDREGVGTALFEGDNAKKFMSDLGYDFKPSILEVSISEYKQQADVDISGNPIYIYNQLTSEKALKSVYVPKNSTGSYSILNRTAYVDEFLGFHVMKTSWTETRQYTYSTSNFMKYGKVLKQLTPLMIDLYKECKTIQFQQMFHR